MNTLEVKALQKSFKETAFSAPKQVLKNISFQLTKGSMTGFLGANGSGKTTTLKCLFNLIPIDQGEVSFFGSPLSRNALKRVGFLSDPACFYDYLTGEELLIFYGGLCGDFKHSELKSRARSLLKKLGLSHAIHQKVKTYSKGMTQKIGIAQALIHHPELIILDEPLSGLDPDSRLMVTDILQNLVTEEGATVFFSSHLFFDVEKMCSHLVVLKDGEVNYKGTLDALLNSIEGKRKVVYKKTAHPSPREKGKLEVKNIPDLQKKIDQLRKTGHEILEIQVDQKNLEETFVKMVFNQKESVKETEPSDREK